MYVNILIDSGRRNLHTLLHNQPNNELINSPSFVDSV